jgi:hypothetical protein
MSGPTSGETQIGDLQLDAYKQAIDLTKAQYANQQNIYAPMVQQLQGIFAKGPDQEGFSDSTLNDLNTEAIEGTAANFRAAAQAAGESEAALGGGNNPLPSGAVAEQKAKIATSAAAEQSKQEQEIRQASLEQGYKEWEAAGGSLEAIAAGENPLGYEEAATSSGSAAEKTQSDIAAEDDAWINAVIGGLAEAGGQAARGGTGGG